MSKELHMRICKELNDTWIKKNHDYGNSFGDMFKKLGIISAVTRIGDKYGRLATLASLKTDEFQVKDESIKDTLLDMANYCIMTVMELTPVNKQSVVNCDVICHKGYKHCCWDCNDECTHTCTVKPCEHKKG